MYYAWCPSIPVQLQFQSREQQLCANGDLGRDLQDGARWHDPRKVRQGRQDARRIQYNACDGLPKRERIDHWRNHELARSKNHSEARRGEVGGSEYEAWKFSSPCVMCLAGF